MKIRDLSHETPVTAVTAQKGFGDVGPGGIVQGLMGADLSDLSGIADGDAIVWDAASSSWILAPNAPAFATPSIAYGAPAGGAASTVIRSDATIAKPTAADVDFSADVTTNNVTTGHHGLAPKGDGNAAHYLDGTGAYSVPAGSGAGTPAGTSFPGSPSTNDLFFRTDLSYLFFYGGTRWLSQQQFVVSIPDRVGGTNLGGVSATTARVLRTGAPPLQGTSDIYIQGWRINYFVSGGTALSASHKWVVTLNKLDSAVSATAVSTITIDGGTSSIFREDTTAPNVLLTRATYLVLEVDCTKTGTPGNLIFDSKLAYRLVAT